MKCLKCGLSLPDDSEFCQYCGEKVEREAVCAAPPEHPAPVTIDEAAIVPAAERADLKKEGPKLTTPPGQGTQGTTQATKQAAKRKYCKRCGGLIDNGTKKCENCGKQYFRAKATVPIVALLILCGALLAGNITQYVWGRQQAVALSESKDEIQALQGLVAERERKVDSLQSQADYQKERISLLEADQRRAYQFDKLCDALETGSLGYASSNFHASESIIVVSPNEKGRKFTLTAHWNSGGTVTTSCSGFSASVDFDKSTWNQTTPMTIYPYAEGITVVTFRNDVNSETFKVIIIVTE